MMAGSRGDGGPDPFTSLLGIVGDQKATLERIKQLQAETAKSEKALAALKTREAELDATAAELDERVKQIAKESKSLDAKQIAVNANERAVAAREAELDDRSKALGAERDAQIAKVSEDTDNVAAMAAALAVQQQEWEDRAKQLDERSKALDQRETMLADLKQELLSKTSDMERKIAAFKALTA